MKNFSIGLFSLLTITAFQSIKAQTADEVVDKYVTALGGKEKLASIKSFKKTGNLSVQGTDVNIVITVLNGVGFRNDISVPGAGEGFQITTPSKGWNFMPFMGQTSPEEVSADQLKLTQHLLDAQGLLYNYKEKGSQVESAGKETIDGAECYKLKLTNKLGKVYTYFIDTKTGYCMRIVSKAPAPDGSETEAESNFSDYKKTDDGYIFPFSQSTPRGTIIFSTIEVNKPVDEKIFSAG